jgi:predicted acetyltransferase
MRAFRFAAEAFFMPDNTPSLSLRRATQSDRPLAERLWLMFRHDLSEFSGQLPNHDGSFRRERVEAAFSDPGWAAYILLNDGRPAGLALIRGLTSRTRTLNSFFVVRGARRTGIGLHAAADLVARYPGPWQVAFQDANVTAVRFWRRVAREISGSAWTEERRPVPGQPGLPPDVWISFEASGPPAAETG